MVRHPEGHRFQREFALRHILPGVGMRRLAARTAHVSGPQSSLSQATQLTELSFEGGQAIARFAARGGVFLGM